MPSGNMTARENHHHKRGTDCQRGERSGAVADDRAPNCQNQEKGPNEFSEVLVHELPRFDSRLSRSRLTASRSFVAEALLQWLWQHPLRMPGQPSSSSQHAAPG